jgi:hypothetical protein
MKAAVFVEPGRIVLEEKPIPRVGPRDAILRMSMTTICGTDVHILKGEYPVAPGLTVGHEPVGVIEELGSAVTRYIVQCPRDKAEHFLIADLDMAVASNPFGDGREQRLDSRLLGGRLHHV